MNFTDSRFIELPLVDFNDNFSDWENRNWTYEEIQAYPISQPILKFIFVLVQKEINANFTKCLFKMNTGSEFPLRMKNAFRKGRLNISNVISYDQEFAPMFYFSSAEDKRIYLTFRNSNFTDLINLADLKSSPNTPIFFFNLSHVYFVECHFERVFTFSNIMSFYQSNILIEKSTLVNFYAFNSIFADEMEQITIRGSNFTNLVCVNSTINLVNIKDSENMKKNEFRDSIFEKNVGFLGGVFHFEKSFYKYYRPQESVEKDLKPYRALSLDSDGVQEILNTPLMIPWDSTESQTSILHEQLGSQQSRSLQVYKPTQYDFYNVTFKENIAAFGGAVYSIGSIEISFRKVSFLSNAAIFGGGVVGLLTVLYFNDEIEWNNNLALVSVDNFSGNSTIMVGIFYDLNKTFEFGNDVEIGVGYKKVNEYPTLECIIKDRPIEEILNPSSYVYQTDQHFKVFNQDTYNFTTSVCPKVNRSLIYFEDPWDTENLASFETSIIFKYLPGLGFQDQTVRMPLFFFSGSNEQFELSEIPIFLFSSLNISLVCLNMNVSKETGRKSIIAYENKTIYRDQYSKNQTIDMSIWQDLINGDKKFDTDNENLTFTQILTKKRSDTISWIGFVEVSIGDKTAKAGFPFKIETMVCPDGFQNTEGICKSCQQNYFSIQSTKKDTCYKCSNGAQCNNGYLYVKRGYWRASIKSPYIKRCQIEEICLGEGEKSDSVDGNILVSSPYNDTDPFDFSNSPRRF